MSSNMQDTSTRICKLQNIFSLVGILLDQKGSTLKHHTDNNNYKIELVPIYISNNTQDTDSTRICKSQHIFNLVCNILLDQ